uniref:Deoxyribonuclease II n=1 Tax=Haemonchus placei TaxID=6290 RepID=A0A0N4VTJ9_HAEPC
LDSNKKGALLPSEKTLDDKDQAIAYTLNQFYEKPFLLEILPFPPPSHYEYPSSGHDYGQTMWCLSFPYSQLGKIATQLYYNKPDIYSSQLPTKIAADYPLLAQVIAGEFKQGEPYSSTLTLTTKAGTNFMSFAKTNEFNKDLYDGIVAPTLKADLIAETWRRGSEEKSFQSIKRLTLRQDQNPCSLTYHTNDALQIQVGATMEFKYTKDHSKMARSTDATKPWVCIGDINRMTSQYIRGGGTTCLSSTFVWQAFNVIKEENSC